MSCEPTRITASSLLMIFSLTMSTAIWKVAAGLRLPVRHCSM